jgi:cellulose synthase/poly-beta-1,6-N-acetylglucosamine synthase-like glycosyltransferase
VATAGELVLLASQAAFWLALAVVAYAYLGYPTLLGLAAWLRPAPAVRKSPITPSVSVVIVARNEEARLEAKLRYCLALDYPREQLEILVVSDGSEDGTEAIAARFAERGVRLLALRAAAGKASALNRAVPQARGEILLFTDARQRLAPDALTRLVAHFADASVGAVSGALHLAPPSALSANAGVGTYWSFEKLVRRAESRLDSTIGVTGAIYALRKELFRPLDERTILDDVAVPMEVVLAGRRVVFEPLAAAWDEISADAAREFRRKVRTLAGNYQLVRLRPELVDPTKNRLFWQFVSHKLARLAVPWCLLLLLASSAALASQGGVYRAALAAQLVLYLCAALAQLLHSRGRASRPLSLPYAFVLLNLAAAAALIGFLRGTETAAWKGTSR